MSALFLYSIIRALRVVISVVNSGHQIIHAAKLHEYPPAVII
jgi:hypothetical protein